jgi:GH24 family phage-related lysozyme (muramidase)
VRQIIEDTWLKFTEPLEGGVACLYNDIRGLTTLAYGNLVNAPSAVVGLPFVHPDGTPATVQEVVGAWHAVHDDPQCATRGWLYAAKLTDLRLTQAGMHDLAMSKLRSNDRILAARVSEWEDRGACVQMAIHSMAWACGPHVHFPRMFAAIERKDYEVAAIEIHMNEFTRGPHGEVLRNAGLVPRNVANKVLMKNASRVESYHLDPDYLNWSYVIDVRDVDTVPDLAAATRTTPPDSSGGVDTFVSRDDDDEI